MDNKKLPKGIRKHIRREKARIRREVEGQNIQKQKIEELMDKIKKSPLKIKK